jgi:CubicO group peptidase (beta-lactamase class C family)
MWRSINRSRRRCGATALTAILLTSAPAGAQQPSQAAIDAIFADYDHADSPGCALAVVRDRRIVYQRGYGSANLDYGIPNGPEMIYYVGSVSKQFTAAAIAILAQEGRIDLDHEVRRYIPELPDYGARLTVRHLVHHTGGLRDIYTLMDLSGIRMQDVLTDEEALGLITRQNELNFAPGTDYLYSNSGYWLLGQIVQRVTGKRLSAYAEEKIFRPLGMHDTHFHDQRDRTIRNRVMSYGGSRGDYRVTYLGNFDKVGAGGLYTTLADLARWDANFYDPKVGGAAFLQTMHTRGVLRSGEPIAYAFGINVQRRRGLEMVRHAGSLMGFRADLVRYPTERFSVITLCNHGAIDPSALADRVTELYLGRRLETAPVAAASGAPRPASAAPSASRVAGGGSSAADRRAYEGRFYSAELDVSYRIANRADALTVERRLTGIQPLRQDGPDRFIADEKVYNFQRDAGGRVTSFTVDAGRVRNIRFVRQE